MFFIEQLLFPYEKQMANNTVAAVATDVKMQGTSHVLYWITHTSAVISINGTALAIWYITR